MTKPTCPGCGRVRTPIVLCPGCGLTDVAFEAKSRSASPPPKGHKAPKKAPSAKKATKKAAPRHKLGGKKP